jgi:hypothetical protein
MYLRVSGRLYPDHSVFLRPSYLTANPRDSVNVAQSPLVIELRREDRVLLRWGLRYPTERKRLTVAGDEPAYVPIRAKIPFIEGTRRIVLLLDDIELKELRVPERGPEFASPVNLRATSDGYAIEWQVTHPESLPLYFHVRTSSDGGLTWRRLASRLEMARLQITRDALVGGDRCLVEVVAYDGINTVSARTNVPDAAEEEWRISILSPQPSEQPLIPPVELHAAGVHRMPDRIRNPRAQPECVWTANGEEIARGADAVWDNPKPGDYALALRARLGDRNASDEVRVRIG